MSTSPVGRTSAVNARSHSGAPVVGCAAGSPKHTSASPSPGRLGVIFKATGDCRQGGRLNANRKNAFSPPNFQRPVAGFSLFELLVVMVIIGLMSVLVVPQLANSLTGTQLKAASKKIAAGLRFARSRAVAEQIGYTASFDFERNRLRIHQLTPKESSEPPPPSEPEAEASSDQPFRLYGLPRGVRFEKAEGPDGEVISGTFEMVFFPNGSCSGGGVVLINERDKRAHLKIDFITGTVRLTDA